MTLVLDPPPLPNTAAFSERLQSTLMFDVTGRVAAITGDALIVQGMTAPIGAICEVGTHLDHPTLARVIGFDDTRPILSPLQPLGAIAAGDPVRLQSRSLWVGIGPSLCGRVIDAFGRPIDGQPLPVDLRRVDAMRAAPGSLQRPPIDTSFQTGVRAIDTMLTCGTGQRLGIFAGSGVGKSTLLGMLTRGSSADRIVIAMIGERGREVQEFIQRALGDAGLKRSVIVVSTSDQPAAQRLTAAWTATSIAESFRDAGENVLLLVDSVTRLAMAQRELGLAAGEPPTTRGYPPSVFNMLPQIVERAGRTDKGSITAFYTVLVEGDDTNEPIADTLRGLLDGHIVLSRTLANRGHYPPIDIAQSLSRLHPHLVTPEQQQAAITIKSHLVQYQQSEDLISIGAYRSGSDPRIDAAIAMRDPIDLMLQQSSDEVAILSQSQQILLQLAAASATAGKAAVTNPEPGAGPPPTIADPASAPPSPQPATGTARAE